ncbi:hypothetical protein AB0M87_02675 [Streptomyces sp. NPDC051320]
MLHVRPWEWARLTVEEADALLGWLDEYNRQIDEAQARLDN